MGAACGGQLILSTKYPADRVVVAEIFPSVLSIEDDLFGLVHDLAQVRTCVRHAAALAALTGDEPLRPQLDPSTS